MTDKKLFEEFAPISTEQWEEIIQKDLKGADYSRKLIWRPTEGFEVRPYYRAEDLEQISHTNSMPGEFPYVRGNKVDNNSWYIRQSIQVKDAKASNEKALELLNKGVNSFGFIISEEVPLDEIFIKNLLAELPLEAIEINFEAGHNSKEVIEILVENNAKLFGSVDFAPLSSLALKGHFCKSEDHSFDKAKDIIVAARELKDFATIAVHGDAIHNSGSSAVQELAFSLASGAEYIAKLVDRGLEAEEIASTIKFNFAVGSNYFMELAKFRAARLLWSRVVEAFGVKSKEAAKMQVHATTSRWNKTIYDPYVNMLRTTTEAMSAILGGIDSLTVEAFNASFEEPKEFGERIARNQQTLLKEESYFDKIADPAAGSYYIEKLTQSIADEAWKLFLEVEEKGGFIESLKAGFIQDSIQKTAIARDQKLAQRREILLGSNQYPNFNESIDTEVAPAVLKASDFSSERSAFETLKPYRGAQAFEALRYATDQFAQENARPKVFMLTMGNLAFRRARAQFAGNFFACAGYETIDNNGFDTVEAAVDAFRASKSQIAVVCSSDEDYATIAPGIYNALKDEAIVVIAGAPACMDDLKAAGIEKFIHVKVNILDELRKYSTELGIA